MSSSQRELLASFLAGDAAAVAEIAGWVRQAAAPFRRRLAFEWEDVLQEALVEVTEHLGGGRYRGEGALRGYVWRLVAHSCLDRLRRHRRWQWEPLEEPALTSGESSPYADAAGRELTRRVLALVATLPPPCRELWAMILDDLSYAEMSERLGVAEGTLRVRVLRCRQQAVARWADVTSLGAGRRKGQEETGEPEQ